GSLASQAAGPQHTAQRLDRASERMLGGGGEADDDAVAVGDLLTGQWMAHPRQALQRDTRLTSPSQHLVLAALGQGQQHVDAGSQTTDANVESGQRVDENVAAPAVTRTHPADVAVVLTAGDEVGHRELVDGVDVELLATGGVDDRVDAAGGEQFYVDAINQLTMADFIASGQYDRHIRRMRARYRRRRDVLVDALTGFDVGISGLAAGVNVLLTLPEGREHEVLRRAGEAGIALQGLSRMRHPLAGQEIA